MSRGRRRLKPGGGREEGDSGEGCRFVTARHSLKLCHPKRGGCPSQGGEERVALQKANA